MRKHAAFVRMRGTPDSCTRLLTYSHNASPLPVAQQSVDAEENVPLCAGDAGIRDAGGNLFAESAHFFASVRKNSRIGLSSM